ncbi:MAG: ApaLI family restriction endonuclease [Rhodobacteraceae bacterium]|nr:ApaLI family restriction endonuclease [Paracoccaceae bacterium]
MMIEQEIRRLAASYADTLKARVDQRVEEMNADDNSHYMIYQVLGITDEEGRLIDIYQNKGRFLYKYAGSFLEEAAKACFLAKYPDSRSVKIPNTIGRRPKTFEIDCLVGGRDALEIKWRDATTDGDHVTKEHTRLQNVKNAGYKPIRVMFYYPNRTQAQRIQKTLETLYAGANGEYYYGDKAWRYVEQYTDINLKGILETIAAERDCGG